MDLVHHSGRAGRHPAALIILRTLDAEFDRLAGVTADVLVVALISGLQIATDVTDMGAKSSSQQAAADESDTKHDEAILKYTIYHWLPMRQRVVFKLAVLVFDCVRRTCPSYFRGVCTPLTEVSGQLRLRLAQRGDL